MKEGAKSPICPHLAHRPRLVSSRRKLTHQRHDGFGGAADNLSRACFHFIARRVRRLSHPHQPRPSRPACGGSTRAMAPLDSSSGRSPHFSAVGGCVHSPPARSARERVASGTGIEIPLSWKTPQLRTCSAPRPCSPGTRSSATSLVNWLCFWSSSNTANASADTFNVDQFDILLSDDGLPNCLSCLSVMLSLLPSTLVALLVRLLLH
mmetsp:Transcript_23624/g.51565  ORF Transcript_23624/g.51565 Transcript_23624/m.51565 type:complete len:208 (+) Transcript_23624:306-929(+)